MSRTFAYTRVSTADQTTENQAQEIAAAGFFVEPHRIHSDTVSGSTAAKDRPEFARLLDKLEAGDVLIVTKLDRLGRNAIDMQSTVRLLGNMGVRVKCLALGDTDLTGSAGKMLMGVIAAMAEFERDLIVERTKAGLERAKAEGKVLGRKRKLAPGQDAEIAKLKAEGKTYGELAKVYDTDRAAIQRAVKRASAMA